jgi:hypothetical protein
MQDNLIFYGIDEPKTETGEYKNTKESLNEFITNKMKKTQKHPISKGT